MRPGAGDAGQPSEEQIALAECRRIIRVLPPRPTPYAVDTRYETVDFRDHQHWPAAVNEFTALVRAPMARSGALFDVPPLPEPYVETPEIFERLRAMLLSPESRSIVMGGETGSGRSTLAAALARDCQVRHRFPNGLYWIYAGSSVEVSGGGRLFVFDYRLPTQRLMRNLEDSCILFTRPSESVPNLPEVVVPPWTLQQVEQLIGGTAELTGAFTLTRGNPLISKVFLSLRADDDYGARLSHIESGEGALRLAAEAWDVPTRKIAAKLGALVPDAKVALSVCRRVLGGEVPLEVFMRLDRAGFIRFLPDDDALVVREGAGASTRPRS